MCALDEVIKDVEVGGYGGIEAKITIAQRINHDSEINRCAHHTSVSFTFLLC